MPPEYVIFGKYSEKSDIFSFGVMVLEIICGKRNARASESPCIDGLLTYVSIITTYIPELKFFLSFTCGISQIFKSFFNSNSNKNIYMQCRETMMKK